MLDATRDRLEHTRPFGRLLVLGKGAWPRGHLAFRAGTRGRCFAKVAALRWSGSTLSAHPRREQADARR